MMQKLQTMAQSLNLTPGQPNAADAAGADAPPGIDIAMLQKLSGFARQSNIDNNQQTVRLCWNVLNDIKRNESHLPLAKAVSVCLCK